MFAKQDSAELEVNAVCHSRDASFLQNKYDTLKNNQGAHPQQAPTCSAERHIQPEGLAMSETSLAASVLLPLLSTTSWKRREPLKGPWLIQGV